MAEEDLHEQGGTGDAESQTMDVEVTFGELTDEDRRVLGKYGRGQTATLRRAWSPAIPKGKMIGNSRQGPGFACVREAGPVATMREAYSQAREQAGSLPAVTAKDAILAALDDWESDSANACALVEVQDDDATHLFGFAGDATLAKRVRLVLIPASADLVAEVGSSGKGSAVAELVGTLMTTAAAAVKAEWEENHHAELDALTHGMKAKIEESTELHSGRVNVLLAALVPKATVRFQSEPPRVTIPSTAAVRTEVEIDGVCKDVGRQGHGVQRAVMMAMLQALVPDEAVAEAELPLPELGEDQDAALAQVVEKLPALIIAIEEPEIYQHPVRARHFATVLAQTSMKPRSQVLLATHSPYFIRPDQFSGLRRFSLAAGCSTVTATGIASIADMVGCSEDRIRKCVEKELPRTFSEGFFADLAVLVEGDTDKVVLEVLADRLGVSLDARGIAVLSMEGKGNLQIPETILRALNIPTFVVVDGDACHAARKSPGDAAKTKEIDDSHRGELDTLLQWIPAGIVRAGSMPYSYGDPTVVTDRCAIFVDDLEHELESWTSFVEHMGNGGHELRGKNLSAYREAAIEADLVGLPNNLQVLVTTLGSLGV